MATAAQLWFQASAAMLMRSALFWDITRRNIPKERRSQLHNSFVFLSSLEQTSYSKNKSDYISANTAPISIKSSFINACVV
jgi:hypothetical protein